MLDMIFQSTLPRGERQVLHMYITIQKQFQSTLPRGERRSLCQFGLGEENFNPRSRVGSDVILLLSSVLQSISIHAPAWGATSSSNCNRSHIQYFNPRSRVGSDVRVRCRHITALRFQSTLPRGERRKGRR